VFWQRTVVSFTKISIQLATAFRKWSIRFVRWKAYFQSFVLSGIFWCVYSPRSLVTVIAAWSPVYFVSDSSWMYAVPGVLPESEMLLLTCCRKPLLSVVLTLMWRTHHVFLLDNCWYFDIFGFISCVSFSRVFNSVSLHFIQTDQAFVIFWPFPLLVSVSLLFVAPLIFNFFIFVCR
jgi:hypothetical protein